MSPRGRQQRRVVYSSVPSERVDLAVRLRARWFTALEVALDEALPGAGEALSYASIVLSYTFARIAVAKCTASHVLRPCLPLNSPAFRATAVETSSNCVAGDSSSARTVSLACRLGSVPCAGWTSARIAVDSTSAISPRSTAASSGFKHANSGSPLITPMSAEASRRALRILSGLPAVRLQVLRGRGGPREGRVQSEEVGPARVRRD